MNNIYEIFTTEEFDKDLYRLDNSEKLRVYKIFKQLEEKGGSIGKPLSRSFLREKKLNGKRTYFLFYEEYKIILVIAMSDKKTQKLTINEIITNIEYYDDHIKQLLKNKTN